MGDDGMSDYPIGQQAVFSGAKPLGFATRELVRMT
jgi:hypothetical protein